jgi:hypothetical protein
MNNTESFSFITWSKARMFALDTSIQQAARSRSQSNQARQEKQKAQVREEEAKLSIADDLILHVILRFPKKPCKLKNKFSKVTGFKIDIGKSVAFTRTNEKLHEKENYKPIPFTIVST